MMQLSIVLIEFNIDKICVVWYYKVMDSFNDLRSDKQFNLENVSYEDLFEGLKGDIQKTICEYEEVDKLASLHLNKDECLTRMKYGKDKDLYPSILLEISARAIGKIRGSIFYCIINPFEIEIHKIHCGKVDILKNENLTYALKDFMSEKFVNSDYLEKREKYFKNAELINKTENKMLFM